ncbi:hypothetical protein Tco_0002172 [Tanacetum coccineum]
MPTPPSSSSPHQAPSPPWLLPPTADTNHPPPPLTTTTESTSIITTPSPLSSSPRHHHHLYLIPTDARPPTVTPRHLQTTPLGCVFFGLAQQRVRSVGFVTKEVRVFCLKHLRVRSILYKSTKDARCLAQSPKGCLFKFATHTGVL